MKSGKMKKYILSSFFSPIVMVFFMLCLGGIAFFSFVKGYTHFFEDWQFCDFLTYISYGFALLVMLVLYRDFDTPTLRRNYVMFFFLWLCALLREAGIQHWIPSKDTTAIKIRFFTNPENPLEEKIFTLVLLLVVLSIIVYLLIKYVPWIWKNFFKLNPIAWTLWCFFGALVVCKFADRFPSHFVKKTGNHLSPEVFFFFAWIEEGLEVMSPLLFIIALVQHHQMKRKLP